MRPGTLSSEQRRLLDHLLDQQGVGTGTARIPRFGGDRTQMPMSFAQQRIWFFDRLQPAETIYNVAGAARLRGRLDVDVLARCLGEVVRRHEVLRTTYRMSDGRPVQSVQPPFDVALPVTDLRHLPPAERDAAVQERCDLEVKRPFDLERGPMLRPILLRVAEDEHLLLLSQHHIATDGWSLNVLMREVSALYAAFAANEASPLEELPLQYGDFAAWQREWLSGEVLDNQLAYWRRTLVDTRLVDVATGLPRPSALTWNGGTLRYAMAAPLVKRLTALAETERATTYMALVAAQAVVLSRWSGQDDVVVGCPVANRNRGEVESLIGCFVNELPLRIDTSGQPSYRDLLRRTREACLGGYAHQDVPFEKVVEVVNPERDAMSHAPLVRHQLGLHNEPQWRVELPDLTFEVATLSTGTARFDLEVDLSPDASGGITGLVYYSNDLYTADVVGRLLQSLTAVVEGAVAAPDAPVWTLPLLADTGRRRLTELGGAGATRAGAVRLEETVLRQAERTPEAVAVVRGEDRLTYRELSERANRLAHWLRHLGVVADTPVVVCMPASPWQMAAVLAVLEAGGAAVPLDPGFPPTVIHAALRDTGARLVLTDAGTTLDQALRLEDLDPTVRTIAVDAVAERLESFPSTPPPAVGTVTGLAFVNYVVEPVADGPDQVRGTANTHVGVAGRLDWMDRTFGPVGRDVVGVRQPSRLDTAPWDLWWPLAAGGQLVIEPAVPHGDPDATPVDILRCTPARLAAELRRRRIAPRLAIVDGESVWPALAEQVRRSWPQTDLVGLHGPASAAGDVIAVPLNGRADRPNPWAPGARVSVVDLNGEPVPIGVPGEICLGDRSVARGYWRRAGATARSYIPDPDGIGARRLRTGLWARWSPDGHLELLGRATEVTEIRGHRVELSEVRDVLSSHADAERAVVMAFHPAPVPTAPECNGSDPQLCAYVSLRREVGDDEVSIRDRRTFEATYMGRAAEDDPVLNIGGWTSPHTGEHISAGEMREWADGTMRRILRLRPRDVLEVGCRTGSLLFRLAPRCETYTATDMSTRALDRIRRHGDWLATKVDAVRLLNRGVDDFSGFAAGSFDTVVLNALVQYFPGVGFLERVLRGAVDVLRPGGHIVMTDVRSLPLLEAMHLSVQWGQQEPGLPAESLRHLVRQRAAAEEELALDPRLFPALADRLPDVTGVWILPRPGRIRNELTLYRFDVIMQVGGEAHLDAIEAVDWRGDAVGGGLTVEAVSRLLRTRRPAPLELRGVPDARLATKLVALRLLQERRVPTVGELTESVQPLDATPGGPVELGELVAVAAANGHDSFVRQSLDGSVGAVDVVVVPRDGESGGTTTLPGAYRPDRLVELTDDLHNDPVHASRAREAIASMRTHVQERLPAYLGPTRYVVVTDWPLGPSGTLDVAALPAAVAQAVAEATGREPSTDTERAIAKIWAEALGLDTIGVHDDFFGLGGHSLLGAEVVEQVREVYKVDLPLGRLFEAPTVAAVAGYVDHALARPGDKPATVSPIGRIDRDGYQTKRARLATASRG